MYCKNLFIVLLISASDPPDNFTIKWIDTKINLSWSHPVIANGPIKHFLLNVSDNRNVLCQHTFTLKHPKSTYEYLVIT